jgi:CHAT domain-containing protein
MRACLSCESGFLSLTCGDLYVRRPLDVAPLADFVRRYAIAREHGDAPALLALGRDLRAWFDAGEDWLVRPRDAITPPLELEILGPRNPDADTWAVLQAPWELLADEQGFLAEDATLRYAPARRLGAPAPPPPLDTLRLGVAFMAGAPIGVKLDFEAEEAAILNAAGQTIDLFVEESGDPEQLGPRLVALTPPLPVLHLSCHGHNAWKGPNGSGTPRPVVMLEDPEGAERPTSAEALIEALGAYRPRFMFVSACLTAAAGQAPGGAAVLADSLATGLIRQGVPAVLGWEGSVADAAATEFAHVLYRALGTRRLPLAEA